MQGVHWCNKRIYHINTPSRCFLKTQSEWSRRSPRSGHFWAQFGAAGAKDLFRRPRTHERHSTIYVQTLSTVTHATTMAYDWQSGTHLARTHPANPAHTYGIPLARISLVSTPLVRIPLVSIPLASIQATGSHPAYAHGASHSHASHSHAKSLVCTQLQAALPAEELQA